jgi:hypothetical protein
MKKINFLLIIPVTIIAAIVVTSCQTTGKASSASKMLKFNFEKGKDYDYEMISSVDQEIMGHTMQMDISAYYSMDVTEDNGNTKTITTSIDRFKMNMEVGGMNLEVDTDKPVTDDNDSSGKKNPLKMVDRIFNAIKGQHFSMKVDAEGKVLEVTGFENMAQSLVDSMGLDEEHSKEMIQKFNQQFNGDQMKEQFERTWYIFPNKEVKVGDTWQKKSETGGMMGGKYNSTYKVTEIEGDMVTLEETTKIESDNKGAKMNGEVKGTLVVDSRVGLVVKADQDMTMKTEAGGKSIEINAKTKIKGKAR